MKIQLWAGLPAALFIAAGVAGAEARIGSEKAIERHLRDGEEYRVPLATLVAHGEALFRASWTTQDGAGRPLSKGTGAALSDPSAPLVFPRNVNRVSGPDANSCAGCHALPRAGGGGDVVTNVFVLGQRFDFVTFDANDPLPTRGAVDERGQRVALQSVANERATPGMFGAGYIEMLAREMTLELQRTRDSMRPNSRRRLTAKGVEFGVLRRRADGGWDTRGVVGLAPASLGDDGLGAVPSLIVRPFHQAGAVVSLREFTNNAFNHHHGMQSSERFGAHADPDGDNIVDELTRADITAATVYQATLPAPGQVIPQDPAVEQAIELGATRFDEIGCAACHVPALPLSVEGSVFIEPNPFNPGGNLQPGDAPPLAVDLSDPALPGPRLQTSPDGVVHVPAYTDLKLHDMCDGPDDPNREPLDMLHGAGSAPFFAGNCRFLTRKLWGVASEPPYFHHGKFTTLRAAVLGHAGEAGDARLAFVSLPAHERDAIIEFLKSLQVLPPGAAALTVDADGRPR